MSRTQTISTMTVTVTSAACGVQQRNVPIDNRGLEHARAVDMDKRGDVLAVLRIFATAKISEGCSCLNLQPKATKTATFTAAAPVRLSSSITSNMVHMLTTLKTVNVVATETQCVVSQPPVCKPAGSGNSCTTTSQCCSGACGAVFDSAICCNPNGGYCDLSRPDMCCSGVCLNTGDLTDLDGTCIE